MDNAQHKWAREELEKAYPSPDNRIRQAVTALLSVWSRVDMPLDRVQQAEAAGVFAKLATLRPLELPTGDTGPKRIWAPASQYVLQCRYARVKKDSVHKDELWKYNDRVAEINGVRSGIMTVTFLDHRDGAPATWQSSVHNFEVDIAHLMAGDAP